MWFIFTLIICFISQNSFSKNIVDDRYYVQLTDSEKHEIKLIKDNYHKYNNQRKNEAFKRYIEIKLNMLSSQERENLYNKRDIDKK